MLLFYMKKKLYKKKYIPQITTTVKLQYHVYYNTVII